jgi:hypothetical protein
MGIPFIFGSALACAIPRATLRAEFIGKSPNTAFAASPAKLVSTISYEMERACVWAGGWGDQSSTEESY